MTVIHILKDGSRIDDIRGHVVKLEDASTLYQLIHKINQKSHNRKKTKLNSSGGLNMSIKENATVKVINGPYVGQTGKICRVYEVIGSAVVAFDNGDIGKVSLSELVEVTPQETTEPKEKREPVEKSEITITPGEFMKIAVETATKASKGDLIVGFTINLFAADLHRALFMADPEND